ncbi:coproporphyrinogen III oxidase [Verrucomicrobiaceae bacterium N1E253]|uniref:coproporphyrinogen oxidase n=1 Tax=Oceaniferula marina TaxID=2748318 RepID=A0A851GFV7_9BACT|nr:coproporphyrinogen III oxidase [Oceaniferula marina]NWK56089.1 coproporphyrinogen III oxidase [Oceaniferula marina]
MKVSGDAEKAKHLVSDLQLRLVSGLEALNRGSSFTCVQWMRDEGRHGGGSRYMCGAGEVYNRASVNVSQVHYLDDPLKKLSSATALSAIIHPEHPYAPSMHMHISWTEMKTDSVGRDGYWRIMADLNPSHVNTDHVRRFQACLKKEAPEPYQQALIQGDRYFFIPAMQRHRGVVHFYLEQYRTDDALADRQLAKRLGRAVVDCYLGMVGSVQAEARPVDASARKQQLAYHTLYLLQVLTLDRGTTSGLLVHDQNDLGIMGSLPARVSKGLLQSWRERLPVLHQKLLDRILDVFPAEDICVVDDDVRLGLAKVVREHYQQFPESLKLLASGGVEPPTVANHGVIREEK